MSLKFLETLIATCVIWPVVIILNIVFIGALAFVASMFDVASVLHLSWVWIDYFRIGLALSLIGQAWTGVTVKM